MGVVTAQYCTVFIFLSKVSGLQLLGIGRDASPVFFEKIEKKCPHFENKYLDCGHLCVKCIN